MVDCVVSGLGLLLDVLSAPLRAQVCQMSLTLYAHPFSSYCQKVLIALWENEIPFSYRHLEEPGAAEERAALWPLGRFPVLVDDGRTIAESSIIIEHLDLHHAGPVQLLPRDRDAALEVRFMDRFFEIMS